MDEYGRMDIAKEAAITIVDTLTVADRVAVISFSGKASQVGGYSKLIRATSENKDNLIKAIKGLKATGSTNFHAAFNTAFNALDTTIRSESTSGCNVAVMFLTDGQISEGPGANEVINLVNDRTKQLATNFDRNTMVFTFSLGHQADHTVTKSIACNTKGIWTAVDDLTGDLVTAMSSYYKLFALGLGEGGNENFAGSNHTSSPTRPEKWAPQSPLQPMIVPSSHLCSWELSQWISIWMPLSKLSVKVRPHQLCCRGS